MAQSYIGTSYPCETKGICLQIFPHHENEIAQSQACACDHDKQQMDNNGTDFVRFWLHNGFVNGMLS